MSIIPIDVLISINFSSSTGSNPRSCLTFSCHVFSLLKIIHDNDIFEEYRPGGLENVLDLGSSDISS